MKKRIKVDFSKLIGRHYKFYEKMEILNWMLATGREHRQYIGRWNCIGVSQALFAYSHNDHDRANVSMFDSAYVFDAIFARAVHMLPSKALREWREKENIYPDKYRMIMINQGRPEYLQIQWWYVTDIRYMKGMFLKKSLFHPDYKKRTQPKIIKVELYTNGYGWCIEYEFSFLEFHYESGWSRYIHQKKDESIMQFLHRALFELIEKLDARKATFDSLNWRIKNFLKTSKTQP